MISSNLANTADLSVLTDLTKLKDLINQRLFCLPILEIYSVGNLAVIKIKDIDKIRVDELFMDDLLVFNSKGSLHPRFSSRAIKFIKEIAYSPNYKVHFNVDMDQIMISFNLTNTANAN